MTIPPLRIAMMHSITAGGAAAFPQERCPVVLAQKDVLLDSLGLEIELHAGPGVVDSGTAAAMQLLQSGEACLAIVGTSKAFFEPVAADEQLVFVASAVMQAPRGEIGRLPLMVRRDLVDSGEVSSVADLAGRRVAYVTPGDMLAWGLDDCLRRGDLTTADVDIVSSDWATMVEQLRSGTLDAGMLNEPLATELVDSGQAVRLVSDWHSGAELSVMVSRRDVVDERGDDLAAFIAAYCRAAERIIATSADPPDEVVEAMVACTAMPAELLLRLPVPHWHPTGEHDVASMDDFQAFLLASGVVDYDGPVDLASRIRDDVRLAAFA